MNEKVLQLLEFSSVLSRVAACSLSEEAAALICETHPLTDPLEAAGLKAQVQAALDRLNSGDGEPRGSIPSIGVILPKLKVEGAAIELEEAYALGLFVERGEGLKRWLINGGGEGAACSEVSHAEDKKKPGNTLGSMKYNTKQSQNNTPDVNKSSESTLFSINNHTISLPDLIMAIPDCSAISLEVFRVLDRDGKLRDLPEFRDIKRRINSLTRDLENAGSRYTGNEETRRMLQSGLPSQRDGRMVLAVKANYRGRIRGIVHEVSATGQTVFVEPEDVVEKNNELLIEQRRLDAEIRRVLREMTAKIAASRDALDLFYPGILELETIRARARYAKETRGVFAIDGDGGAGAGETAGVLALCQARHPLLGSAAVPIDFAMDGSIRTVIITGPNTGGKTVTLKTVGLFVLMNQCGLALPAAEGTALPIFDGVYADIGDEQSLSQSLSTFSAHMTNIAAISGSVGERSLVLLDELGSGTDPEEGSAIAMAILDYLIEKKVRLLATTHHGILKNYGYTREAVENASVDFDSRTLSPTYRIVMGVPGESRAVDIAARNGLPAPMVEGARSYLAEERADVSALISGLKEKHRELAAADEGRRQEETRLREARRAADLKELRLRQKELEMKSGGMGKFRELLHESRKTLENLVREVKEGELSREKTLKVKDFLRTLEETVNAEDAALEAEETAITDERRRLETLYGNDTSGGTAGGRKARKARNISPGLNLELPLRISPADSITIMPGTDVLAGEQRRRGTVLRSAKKGAWIVEIGSLKMTFNEADLIPLPPSAEPKKPSIAPVDYAETPQAKLELSLLGMRLEEALSALERQLDAAVLGGLHEFSVVHGKGDGILQRGVHDFLKKQPAVGDYYFSRPELGGFGRTEVILRE
ncbi:endonuclease MutS2 [Treponema primitia]|uniref:endonuclease MutS2 n=1 Tax=Treponema primitia TaxID=88058 RepID=UPI0002554D06|nr:Smr/MutS family protein [Treponema primitia]